MSNKIMEFAQSLEKEVEEAKLKYENKLAELSAEAEKLKDRDKKSKSKKAELDAREELLAQKEKEVEKDLKKIRDDKQMDIDLADARSAKEQAKKALKEAETKLAETKLREEEIAKRELKLSRKASEYKQEIEKELLSKFLQR